jgi:hypothetical protein
MREPQFPAPDRATLIPHPAPALKKKSQSRPQKKQQILIGQFGFQKSFFSNKKYQDKC